MDFQTIKERTSTYKTNVMRDDLKKAAPSFDEWVARDNHNYMIFSKRLQKLCEADMEDIWILDCNEKFEECILYLSNCKGDNEIIRELSIRPWLQRLFIAYSSNVDFLLFHGALIDIGGVGIALLGDSGMGKSTMCDLLYNTKATVIADDRFMLDLSEELICSGTPWNIKNPHYGKNMNTKLEKVFILSHGNNQIKDIRNSYYDMVYSSFPAMICSPLMAAKESMVKKTKCLNHMKKKCEIYTFAFEPNMSAVPYIVAPQSWCLI